MEADEGVSVPRAAVVVLTAVVAVVVWGGGVFDGMVVQIFVVGVCGAWVCFVRVCGRMTRKGFPLKEPRRQDHPQVPRLGLPLCRAQDDGTVTVPFLVVGDVAVRCGS